MRESEAKQKAQNEESRAIELLHEQYQTKLKKLEGEKSRIQTELIDWRKRAQDV